MEQLRGRSALSGAETLEHETGVKPPKWNSSRAETAIADAGLPTKALRNIGLSAMIPRGR